MKVILYSTAGCHLCEQAKQILWPLAVQYQLRLKEVDVADDEVLMSRYGIRIPVLCSPTTERELSWPFSVKDADMFFAELADM